MLGSSSLKVETDYISLELNHGCMFKDTSGLICLIMYPLGLNLFFQPGLGPGFFLILGSSGTFGLLLLLFGVFPLRALEEEERERETHVWSISAV